jgi:Mrp family chromosome partitioning ATPase
MDQAQLVQEQCRQICLSVFFREHAPVRTLGFTSPIGGEGKSFLSLVTAKVLASDSFHPVTLIDCNWYHPSLHQALGCHLRPGLAEWLRGECHETHIRHQVGRNLTFIPAGSGKQDVVKLLDQIHKKGLLNLVAHSNDLLIVDLPSIVNTACGSLAASLTESLIIVVRAGVTPDTLIAEACEQLKNAPIHGLVLNQMESHIPRWLQQLL